MNSCVVQIGEQFGRVQRARDEMRGRLELLREQQRQADTTLETETRRYSLMCRSLDMLRAYALLREQVLKTKIDSIVTRGLQVIFGGNYASKLDFGISRGQAVIIPKVVKKIGNVEFEATIKDANGGGIANVCAVIYQMLILSLVRPRQRQVLFLDEPFKNVSMANIDAAGEFLKVLNEKLGIQIVIITHHRQTQEIADRTYEFSINNGETSVKQIGDAS